MENYLDYFKLYILISALVSIFLIWKFLSIAKDVKTIRKSTVSFFDNWEKDFRVLVAHGYNTEAKKLLVSIMWEDPIALRTIDFDSIDDYKELKKKYLRYFDSIEVDFPEFIKLRSI